MMISGVLFYAMAAIPSKQLRCVGVDNFGNTVTTVEEHVIKETTEVKADNLLTITYTTADGRIMVRYLVNEICALRDEE